MSINMTREDIVFHQRILRACDLYHDSLDGIWGKNTSDANNQFNILSTEIKKQYQLITDLRTQNNISTLILSAQQICNLIINNSIMDGYDIKVLSGTRTYQEQNILYSQGRTLPGKIVTQAKGGQSLHNFGIAWDIGLFENGKYITDILRYIEFKKSIPKTILDSIEWGGDWKSIKDYPHYQLKTITNNISDIRFNFENGKKYIA